MANPSERFVNEDPWRVLRIMSEFVGSFEKLSHVGPAVTIFGSARTKPSDPYYKATIKLAAKLAHHQIAILTGGGPGIMEAANKGAFKAGGQSIGLNIELPFEQSSNAYINVPVNFHYFFSRKVCLVKYSSAFVYMPGGFGTLDEFYEVITLVQTGKLPRLPIILFGTRYWKGLLRWMKSTLSEGQFINPADLDLVTILDDPDEAADLIINHIKQDGATHEVPIGYA